MEYIDNLITRLASKCAAISPSGTTGSITADNSIITVDSTLITIDNG
jgi:hypothetical protein